MWPGPLPTCVSSWSVQPFGHSARTPQTDRTLSIEKVQRRFTKTLWKLNIVSYPERLHHLGIPSLELRRLYFDLMYCYKIVFGLVHVKFEDFFTPSTSLRTRGHPYNLFKSYCCTATRSYPARWFFHLWRVLDGLLRVFIVIIMLILLIILNVIRLFCFYSQW